MTSIRLFRAARQVKFDGVFPFSEAALMNDEIQLIGTTTHEEFRNSIEKDNSFLRCFQILKLEEPDQETLLQILRAYRVSLENYHHVIMNDEALETTLMWVKILLRDRALPDKALDVLDRSAARISIEEKVGHSDLRKRS